MALRTKCLWGVAALGLLALLGWSLAVLSGTVVTVENQGGKDLTDVVVTVRGGTYPVGTLRPGQRKTAGVTPRGESAVALRFTDPQGKPVEWRGGYIGSGGYHMRIQIGHPGGVTEETELKLLPGLARFR